MKLDEALKLCSPTQYLARDEWINNNISIQLITSAQSIEEMSLELTNESLNANDWNIYEINEVKIWKQ